MIDYTERAKDLAELHWEYVKGVLEHTDLADFEIQRMAFHYLTAFEHGYKHALEDKENEETYTGPKLGNTPHYFTSK